MPLSFVQRKKRVVLGNPPNSSPNSLANLPFLGHAIHGGIYCTYFEKTGEQNSVIDNGQYDFELTTLTLVEGFQKIDYSISSDGGNETISITSSSATTEPLVFPFLANLMPSSQAPVFLPTLWHGCDDMDKNQDWLGKFGCPRLALDLEQKLIILKYTGQNAVKLCNGENQNINGWFFVMMILPSQQLMYYVTPNIHATLGDWTKIIKAYRDNGGSDLCLAADSPIIFSDILQMNVCFTVNIPNQNS